MSRASITPQGRAAAPNSAPAPARRLQPPWFDPRTVAEATEPAARHGRRAARRAFTLVEMVVALGVTAVLLLSIASAMVMVSHAVPDTTGPAGVMIEAGRCLEELSTDLQHALHVSERGVRAITFTVADRDGDGSPERIRYAWSGNPGTALTRQINDLPATVVIDDVDHFALSYTLDTIAHAYPGPPTVGLEQSISSYEGYWGLGDHALSMSDWLGQHVRTGFGDEVVAWRPTRLFLHVRNSEGEGEGEEGSGAEAMAVQIQSDDLTGMPTGTVLHETLVPEINLASSAQWHEVRFAHAPSLRPGQRINLIVKNSSGTGVAGRVTYDPTDAAGDMLMTTDAGANWTRPPDESLQHYFYGTPMVASAARQITRRYVREVHLTLRPTGAAERTIDTRLPLLNTPAVVTDHWAADFTADPTGLDVNADGHPDWVTDDGSTFDTSALADGIWHAGQTIHSQPASAFTDPTTIDLRLRHAVADGSAAVAWTYADWTAGTTAPLAVIVQRQSDGTQLLMLYTRDEGDGWRALTQRPGLPGDFLDVRLLIDPPDDLVHLRINGLDKGTYAYGKINASGSGSVVGLSGSAGSAQFDAVTIRVGGGS